MSYAGEKLILDADSHLMELPDFLSRHADPAVRDLMPSFEFERLTVEGVRFGGDAPEHPPETVETLISLGDRITWGPKWHDALGSFNGGERAIALNLLGFKRQVIFSSFCAGKVFDCEESLRYPTARAHNSAMAEFCSADPRLFGVAMVTLDDPAAAVLEIKQCIKEGLKSVWIPARAPGGRSPGHSAHDPIWRLLSENSLPFLLHVGSSTLSIADEWMNDGFSERQSARGRAEVIGSKDLTVIFQDTLRFLSVLVLDGVLEKFPDLRGGAIEIGAGWVPDMIRRLDHAADIWKKSEPHLATMKRKPSEQIRQQLRFTPYPFEDVGMLIEQSNPDLYLFSSDYPHAEGGRDPIGRFSKSLMHHSQDTQDAFFQHNFRTLYPHVE
ncbi:MAG: amidohydrolase family protein [bacterium]|nr:amidohydrolase [Gammaproteobacteria bacterium]HIL97790.1 amidohydrolase [Pseudomonadales bacterium]